MNHYFNHIESGENFRVFQKSDNECLLFRYYSKSVWCSDGWYSEDKEEAKGVFDSVDSAKEFVVDSYIIKAAEEVAQ